MLELGGESFPCEGSHFIWDSEDGTVPECWALRMEWCLRCQRGGVSHIARARETIAKALSDRGKTPGRVEVAGRW